MFSKLMFVCEQIHRITKINTKKSYERPLVKGKRTIHFVFYRVIVSVVICGNYTLLTETLASNLIEDLKISLKHFTKMQMKQRACS